MPIISKAAFIEDPNLRFTIDTKNSYTVYDPENGFLNVRITRGGDTSEVVGLKFVIGINGESIVRIVRDDEVVKPNMAKVYQFAIGFFEKIDEVKLVPIYLHDGKEIEGSMYTLQQRIPTDPNALDDQIGEEVDGIELSEGLIFYYSFNEPPTDDQIMDLSGYGHTGEVTGTLFDSNGKVGGAYVFDGTSDFIDINDKEDFAIDSKT